jgi:hypothetical protein
VEWKANEVCFHYRAVGREARLGRLLRRRVSGADRRTRARLVLRDALAFGFTATVIFVAQRDPILVEADQSPVEIAIRWV